MEANTVARVTAVGDAEVRQYIRGLVANVLGIAPAEIQDAELLTSYGLNSVDLIDIVVKLEAKYGAKFEPEAMRHLTCQSLAENVMVSAATKG